MSGLTLPPADAAALRSALRANAGRWIARFYRHELLVSRTVRGMQIEAQEEFDRAVVRPLLQAVASRLATFDLRGPDVVYELFPELRQLEAEMRAIVARGSDAVRRLTTDRLHDLTKAESDWVQESATKVLRVPAPAPPDSVVRTRVEQRPFLGDRVEGWFGKMLTGPTGDKARAWIQTGLQRGLTVDEMVRGLRGTKAGGYRDGILTGQSRLAVATLVRTAATHASTISRDESFRQIGVTHWRFVATLDSKTSIQCAANDGKVFPLGKGPMPPLHPNCRSTAVPDFGDPIGTRASIDGPVPADVTFQDWLEDQGVQVQNEVLGATKAAAWRSGKLSIDQMLGRDLQPLTLEQLRRLDRIPDGG